MVRVDAIPGQGNITFGRGRGKGNKTAPPHKSFKHFFQIKEKGAKALRDASGRNPAGDAERKRLIQVRQTR